MDNRLKEFYKKYPDRFIEDILEMKLFIWQKILLRLLIKEGGKNVQIPIPKTN